MKRKPNSNHTKRTCSLIYTWPHTTLICFTYIRCYWLILYTIASARWSLSIVQCINKLPVVYKLRTNTCIHITYRTSLVYSSFLSSLDNFYCKWNFLYEKIITSKTSVLGIHLRIKYQRRFLCEQLEFMY